MSDEEAQAKEMQGMQPPELTEKITDHFESLKPAVHVEEPLQPYITKWIISIFAGGLTFNFLLFLVVILLQAFYPNSKVNEYFTFENGLKLLTTFGSLIGGPLGYVIAHYFRV